MIRYRLRIALLCVLVAATFSAVDAACPGTDASFWQFSQGTQVVSNPGWCTVNGYTNPTSGCYGIWNDPGSIPTSITADLVGTFWVLGEGVPGPGGTDSGTLGRDRWIYPFDGYDLGDPLTGYYGQYAGSSYAYPMVIGLLNWNVAGIDGCVSDNVATPDRCLCMSFSDQIDGQGYFAVTAGTIDSLGNTTIASSGQLQLQPIPRPGFIGAVHTNQVANLTMAIGDPGAGVIDTDCSCAPVGYRLYYQTTPRGAGPPLDRAIDSGWVLADTADDLGAETTVSVDCTGNLLDVYLAASLVFPDGFETAFVSRDSTRVECGPQLATPGGVRRLREGDAPSTPQRGTRSGRRNSR